MKKFLIFAILILFLLSSGYLYQKNLELNEQVSLNRNVKLIGKNYKNSSFLNLLISLKLKPIWEEIVHNDSLLLEFAEHNNSVQGYKLLFFIDSNHCWSCIEFELENLKNTTQVKKNRLAVIAIGVSKGTMQKDERFEFLEGNVFEVKKKGLISTLKTLSSQPFYIIIGSNGQFIANYIVPKFDRDGFEEFIHILRNETNE